MERPYFHLSAEPQSISVTWQGIKFEERGTAQASIFVRIEGAWYLNRVVVHPVTNRGNGIGSQMLKKLQAELTARGCTQLIVEPGGYGSDPKVLGRFYRRHGFRKKRGEDYLVWSPR